MQRRPMLLVNSLLVLLCLIFIGQIQAQDFHGKNGSGKKTEILQIPNIPQSISDALQSRNCPQAIKLIDAVLKNPNYLHADYLVYLKGLCQTDLHLYGESIKTFEHLKTSYPKSDWRSRARFGQADAYVRQRDYRTAGEIYKAEAIRLLSLDRQDELTKIYLEFADRYFEGVPAKGPTSEKKPDYNQALTYYRESLNLRMSVKRRQTIDLRIADSLRHLKKYPEAVQAYKKYLAEYTGKKIEDKNRSPKAMEAQARFQLGHSHLLAGQAEAARTTWQDFINSPLAQTDKELTAKATYNIAKTYGMPNPNSSENLELGVSALEKFLKQYASHKLAPQAEYDIAMGYLSLGRFEEGVKQLKAMIANQTYVKSTQIALARGLLGETYFAQKKFLAAIAAWKDFLAKHPDHQQWKTVQQRIMDTEYEIAAEFAREKKYAQARKQWEIFLNAHPVDPRAQTILYHFGSMKFAEATQKHLDALKAARDKGEKPDPRKLAPAVTALFEVAMSEWNRVVGKYPNTKQSSQAQYMVGVTLEDRLGKLAKALEAYKKVTGPFQNTAKLRIQNLTAKKMEILTERKFRTGEKPYVKIQTRNIEKLTVKAYRIDLTSYFRKMHLAGGVETLDIALIDPDKSWEYQVKDYEKYRRLENEIAIPVDGAGVTAVTISGEKLEATTMVIVSDLDVIVKASRNELFVFAENLKTQKPLAGVSLLISDGSKVFAEEITNAEGILQKSYKDLKTVKDLRVFAVHEGNTASTVSSLEGLNFAVGLSPTAYLYTDRPAYRAGELVNLKGIVRNVENDSYTFKAGDKFRLDVLDPAGGPILQKEIALGKFGTFADHLFLPRYAPQGNYKVHIFKPDGSESYETTFLVHEMKLQPVQLKIDLPKRVYFRGEKIKGKIKLQYYYGTPLAEKNITYRLNSGKMHEAKTDAKGEVEFEFKTDDYQEDAQLHLQAIFPERSVGTGENINLATRGFAVAISSYRSVYVSGETFDAVMNVADPAGKPVATDLTLEVFKLMISKSRKSSSSISSSAEKLVHTFKVKTDKTTGEIRQTLKLDKAGVYILRAKGIDQFGNSVSGQHSVRISGDDDSTRLRILSDKHHYSVGDVAQVKLHWREKPALALLTYEGAKVLGHQVVNLKTGTNLVKIPVTANLAPNFVLSVAVIEQNKFHQAQSDFRVTRKLKIALKPGKSTLRPGEELTVEITVTDPQGNPVTAEIAIGLVQQNLLDMMRNQIGDTVGALEATFSKALREPSVRVATSATYFDRPKTRGINRYLLAENEREQILLEELAALKEVTKSLARREKPASEMDKPITRAVTRQAPDIRNGESDDYLGTHWKDLNQRGKPSNLGGLVDEFNSLYKQGRFAEAESIAGTVLKIEPKSSTAMSMFLKARLGQRSQQRNNTGSQGFLGLHEMQEIEESAIPFSNNRFQSGGFTRDGVLRDFTNGRESFSFSFMSGGGGGFGGGGQGGGEFGEQGKRQSQSGFRFPNASPRGVPQKRPSTIAPGFGTPQQDSKIMGKELRERYLFEKDKQPLMDLIQNQKSGKWKDFYDYDEIFHPSTLSMVINQTRQIHTEITLDDISNEVRGTLGGINFRGEYQVINGIPVAKLKRLEQEKLVVMPGSTAAETGYWNPAVLTDKNGKATITFRLPDRSTAWNLSAKGLNVETLTGQAETTLVTKKELSAELKTPLAFYEGDKAMLSVEVQNSVLKKGDKIAVVLETKIGNRTTKLSKSIVVEGPGIHDVSFPVEITQGETASFSLAVNSGKYIDKRKIAVPIRPYGMPVFATRSGSSEQSTSLFIEHDKRMSVKNPQLEILIGPSVNRTLLDALLGGDLSRCDRAFFQPRSPMERTFSNILGGVALLKMIRKSREVETPETTAISNRIRSGIAQLISGQHKDGGWSWTGKIDAPTSNTYLSSRLAWALSQAKAAGFVVPPATMNKAVTFLKSALAKTGSSENETRAIILHGLAATNHGDFTALNRLYRERNGLSDSGLLHTALALAKIDRKEMARDLLNLVKLSTRKNAGINRVHAKLPPWMHNETERRALYLLALEAVDRFDKRASFLANWLIEHRYGSRWPAEKANGPAIAALAEWYARFKFSENKYSVTVSVNGSQVRTLEIDPAKDATRKVAIPEKFLVKGKQQRINLDLKGRGDFSYSVVLSGFVPAEKLLNTTTDWRVTRIYQPEQRKLKGQYIPRGFGILVPPYKTFTNPLTQLPVGDAAEVTISVRRTVNRMDRKKRDYLVITEPIPAGAVVHPDSVKGNFERFEISGGKITFYVGTREYVGDIRYTLTGYLPGEYRTVPTVVRSFYQPEHMAVSKPKPLVLLEQGKPTQDVYRLSPLELFEFGKRHFADHEYKFADKYLSQLVTDYRLKPSQYKLAVQRLFRTSLKLNRNDRIVEFFEIIKEKYPAVEIDFDAIMKVANAYRDLGEYERGYLVYRATVEAAFARESQIAGFLDNRGEFLRSIQIVDRFLHEYPAESYVSTATYSLAQEIFGKAPEASRDAKLKDAKITRVDLVSSSIDLFDHFLNTWPGDPVADQAAFAQANAYLNLKKYDTVISRSQQFAKRYPKSDLLDSFWYIIGYSEFANGKHDEALKMCKKVAEYMRKDPASGVDVAAVNKWESVYIMGQIYHSLGKAGEAIAEYKRVKSRFADAAEAIDFFTRKEIKLPEITTVQPGKAVNVKLDYRNVRSANVKVYRIDLMKFGLMQRNLNRITAINLAGIKPYHEMTLNLGDGKDYGDRDRSLALPLKDEGAYLVVCRGENLYASGLVLISPLKLQIQEDATSGRVRVTVKDDVKNRYLKDVHVKAIGSANKDFISGDTDLRGIFTADKVNGTSTIIARLDKNLYAFYRGKEYLGSRPRPQSRNRRRSPNAFDEKSLSEKQSEGKDARGELLDNLMKMNDAGNMRQRKFYKNMLQNKSKGVQIKKAFK